MSKLTIFSKITQSYEQELIEKLKGWVNINSQYDEATRNASNPFGIGVSEALY